MIRDLPDGASLYVIDRHTELYSTRHNLFEFLRICGTEVSRLNTGAINLLVLWSVPHGQLHECHGRLWRASHCKRQTAQSCGARDTISEFEACTKYHSRDMRYCLTVINGHI
jgi:hypothetical protein